jgi:hypothetical protein
VQRATGWLEGQEVRWKSARRDGQSHERSTPWLDLLARGFAIAARPFATVSGSEKAEKIIRKDERPLSYLPALQVSFVAKLVNSRDGKARYFSGLTQRVGYLIGTSIITQQNITSFGKPGDLLLIPSQYLCQKRLPTVCRHFRYVFANAWLFIFFTILPEFA